MHAKANSRDDAAMTGAQARGGVRPFDRVHESAACRVNRMSHSLCCAQSGSLGVKQAIRIHVQNLLRRH